MPFVSGSARRFFEFRGRGRELFRNERCAQDSAYVRRMIIAIVGRSCALSFRDLVIFFFFFFLICD